MRTNEPPYTRSVRTVVVRCESCTKDGGRPSDRDCPGKPVKLPLAAVDNTMVASVNEKGLER